MKQQENPSSKKKKYGSFLTFFIVVFALAIIITSVACFIISSNTVMNDIKNNASGTAYSVSGIISDLYNANENQNSGLLQGSSFREDQRMTRISHLLHYLCKDMDLTYLYVFDVDEENNNLLYYFTAAADDEMNKKVSEERGFGTVVNVDPLPQNILNAYHGNTDGGLEQYSNQYGDVYSWVYPLLDTDGNVEYLVGAEFSAKSIQNKIIGNTLRFCLPIVIILIVVFTVMMLIIRGKLLKPLKKVSKKMRHFIEDKDTAQPLTLQANNEVGMIADSFNKMQSDINAYLSEISTLTTRQVQHQTQMEIAQRIQYGIVPAKTDLSEQAYQVYAIEQPCKNVGGDFYDCFLRGEEELCLVVGDVSGKGITAALFMVMTKTAVREKLLGGLSPAEVLNKVNDEICQANPEGLFATVFVAILHLPTGQLTYANAGHNLPLFFREEIALQQVDPGIPLGLFEEAGIINAEVLLSPQEGILLYTDGVTEAVNGADRFFGDERLLGAVKGAADAKQAAEQLKKAVEAFCGEREPFDDLTIISAFYRERVPQLQLESNLAEFDKIKQEVMNMAGEASIVKKLLLVCDELFANIVSYAQADTIEFYCCKRRKDYVLMMIDNGQAFDPLKDADATKEFDDWDTGGMGLSLVKQLAKTLLYRRAGNRNCLLVTISGDHELPNQ